MRRYWRLAVALLCSFGGGLLTAWGLMAMMDREGGGIGGEALLLPLMAGLVYLGYTARQMVEGGRE